MVKNVSKKKFELSSAEKSKILKSSRSSLEFINNIDVGQESNLNQVYKNKTFNSDSEPK